MFLDATVNKSIKINKECSSSRIDFLGMCAAVRAIEIWSQSLSYSRLAEVYENTTRHTALTSTLGTTIANITQARAFFFFEAAVHTLHTAPNWETDTVKWIAKNAPSLTEDDKNMYGGMSTGDKPHPGRSVRWSPDYTCICRMRR